MGTPEDKRLEARERLNQAHKEWAEATKAFHLSPSFSIELSISLREATFKYEAMLNEFYLTWGPPT